MSVRREGEEENRMVTAREERCQCKLQAGKRGYESERLTADDHNSLHSFGSTSIPTRPETDTHYQHGAIGDRPLCSDCAGKT